MPEVVPIPQGATVGYDQPQQSASPAPAGQPASGAGVVPIPEGATVGYGDETKAAPAAATPAPSLMDRAKGAAEAYNQVSSDVGTGILKGAGQTVHTVSNLINKIPLVGETLAPKQGVTALKEETTPKNTAEKVGVGVESVAEFLAGDAALSSLSVAKRLGMAEKLVEFAKTSPRLSAILTHGLTAMRGGTVVGGQELLHGATPAEALKTAGIAALTGAGTGAAIEGAGALKNLAADTLDRGVVQKPLIQGVREGTQKAAVDSGAKTTAVPRLTYKESPTGELGNMDRKVTSMVGDTKVGELHAQTTGVDGSEVTIRFNNLADDVNKGKGYGKAQLNTLISESAKDPKVKMVSSDIKTTEDAANVWKSMERDFPGAVKRQDFPDGNRKWTLDVQKWREANGPELAKQYEAGIRPVAEHPSISMAGEQTADAVYGIAKNDYEALDVATNGKFQRFRDKARNGIKQLSLLGTSAEDATKEASILNGMKTNEESMKDAFDEARKAGVNPEIIDRADKNFRQASALYEWDGVLKRAHTMGEGGTAGVSTADYLKHRPEALDVNYLRKRVEDMFKSGRLSDALGEQGARDMLNHVNDMHLKDAHILRNQKIAKAGAKIVGLAGLGGLGYHTVSMGSHIATGQ